MLLAKCILIFVQFITISDIGNISNMVGDPNPVESQEVAGQIFIRAVGTFDNPNMAAFFILLLIPFVLYNIERSNNTSFNYFIIIISAFAILMTFSRGAMFMFILIITINYIIINGFNMKFLKNNKIILMFNILLLVVLLFIVSGTQIALIDRISDLFSKDDEGSDYISRGSLLFRLEMIRISIMSIIDNTFYGVGFNQSKYILHDYSEVIPHWWIYNIHNIPLKYAVELGVISGVSWLYILIKSVYKPFHNRSKSEDRIIFLSTLVGLFFCMFYLVPKSHSMGVMYLLIVVMSLKN